MQENLTPNQSEFLLYTSQNGEVKVDVLLQNETVWLPQKGMQELFGKAKSTVSEHIKNVFKEGELDQELVRTGCSEIPNNHSTQCYAQ